MMSFLADPLSPLPTLSLQAMPGTPEASSSNEYIDMEYFKNLDDEEITQEQRADALAVKMIIADTGQMAPCVGIFLCYRLCSYPNTWVI